MTSISDLRQKYIDLDHRLGQQPARQIDAGCLLAFDYEDLQQPIQVSIDTEEFTAVCPWTGLPDYGTLTIEYSPYLKCLELKSLKYYLMSYRDVGIVQEHAASHILKDLVAVCQPRWMKVTLDYKVRGGIHTTVAAEYPTPQQAVPCTRSG